MKTILITGASGLVATELICSLANKEEYNLLLVSTHPQLLKERYCGVNNIFSMALDEVLLDRVVQPDLIIHAGFARSGKGQDYVDSLTFTKKLLEYAKRAEPKAYINISSQSVYGDASQPLWKEDAPLGPTYLYALAKYASEKLTELALEGTSINWTNVRLCSVCENARFVSVFVKNAIEGKPINLTAPNQQCSFIDVRDVASGLKSMIDKSDTVQFEKVYNLGSNYQHTIREVAEKVKSIGENEYTTPEVLINVLSSDNENQVGMDASLFRHSFDWQPRYSLDDMIRSLFDLIQMGG